MIKRFIRLITRSVRVPLKSMYKWDSINEVVWIVSVYELPEIGSCSGTGYSTSIGPAVAHLQIPPAPAPETARKVKRLSGNTLPTTITIVRCGAVESVINTDALFESSD